MPQRQLEHLWGWTGNASWTRLCRRWRWDWREALVPLVVVSTVRGFCFVSFGLGLLALVGDQRGQLGRFFVFTIVGFFGGNAFLRLWKVNLTHMSFLDSPTVAASVSSEGLRVHLNCCFVCGWNTPSTWSTASSLFNRVLGGIASLFLGWGHCLLAVLCLGRDLVELC